MLEVSYPFWMILWNCMSIFLWFSYSTANLMLNALFDHQKSCCNSCWCNCQWCIISWSYSCHHLWNEKFFDCAPVVSRKYNPPLLLLILSTIFVETSYDPYRSLWFLFSYSSIKKLLFIQVISQPLCMLEYNTIMFN